MWKKPVAEMELNPVPGKERLFYPDLLRAMAIFSVVAIHCILEGWGAAIVGSKSWLVLNLYLCLIRWGVPIFVMLSGMFLLDPQKEVGLKKTYGDLIPRVLVALVGWGIFYSIFRVWLEEGAFRFSAVAEGLRNVLNGQAHYHLWFLYMIIGLYLIVPILRVFTAKAQRRDFHYFFLLAFFVLAVTPWVKRYPETMMGHLTSELGIHLVAGYVGYFLAGYYLKTYQISAKWRRILYIFGILGMLATISGTVILSYRAGSADAFFFNHFSANMMLTCVALFLFVKNATAKISFSARFQRVVRRVARVSFTVYLCHDVMLMLYHQMGQSLLLAFPVLTVPLLALAVFLGSMLLAFPLSALGSLLSPFRWKKRWERKARDRDVHLEG